MLKMVKDKNTVVIGKIKDKYKKYKVVVAVFWEGKPVYNEYETNDNLMNIIEMYEEQDYESFETKEEWAYKFIRMC